MKRKMTIKEMIRQSIEDSERWRGGLGSGAAERNASEATPDRANRPVDQTPAEGTQTQRRATALCRVIGFIPLSREGC